MGDLAIRVIPADHEWQPSPAAAAALAGHVSGLFAAESVEARFYDRVRLIDTELVICPRCGVESEVGWLYRLCGPDGSIGSAVEVPCCRSAVPVPELRFDWPLGFARFEVRLANPTRPGAYELDDAELAEAGAVLGHPVTQVLAA